MADTIRCPSCGGLNPSGAQWCGQCLRRFADTEPSRNAAEVPPAAAVPRPPAAAPRETGDARAAPGESETGAALLAAEGVSRGAFTVTKEGITWTCPTCESPNPIDSYVCSVCGTSFSRMVHPPREAKDRDPNMATLVSLFFPGAGHAYLGLWPEAIARAVVSLWALSVAVIAAFGANQSSGRLVTFLFGMIAFALWGINAHDTYRAARKENDMVILKGRGFLFLVLGLLGLLLLILVESALRAR